MKLGSVFRWTSGRFCKEVTGVVENCPVNIQDILAITSQDVARFFIAFVDVIILRDTSD